MADKKATIHIPSVTGARGTVRGGHNGVTFELPTDTDITVSEGILDALSNSGQEFRTISPAAGKEGAPEGSGASSTVSGTAIRLDVPKLDHGVDDKGNSLPAHELSQAPDGDIKLSQTANTGLTGTVGADGNVTTGKAPKAKAPTAKASPAKKRLN